MAFPKGQVIIHEGDQGDSFFQIISGLTRVFRTSEDGVEVTLATIGPGESFGEMALLTGEPRSASVETLESSGVLVISKQSFDQLAAENPEFSLALSRVLSSRLAKGGFNLVSATSTEKAYQRFVSEQSEGQASYLIGRSRIVKQLQTRIQEVARNDKPVLIIGESGTEKRDVYKNIMSYDWPGNTDELKVVIRRAVNLAQGSIPSFIRNYGAYLGAAGLVLIFLSDVVFNMPFSPRATAGLVLSIALPAVILALIYRRRVWCRFLCPLGKWVGFLSRGSFLELRANHDICNNDCMENICYVGNENQEGCPVFEAPFALNTNQDCIKNCPNQSPVLNLRVPGQELWNFRKSDQIMATFGPLLMGTQLFRGLVKTDYMHYNAAVFNSRLIFFAG